MSIYHGFARIYTKRLWPEYSRGMAVLLPELLKKYGLKPELALDIACGEGTFAVAMAKAGLKMTGVDQSMEMLELAAAKAAKDGFDIVFINRDMRDIEFEREFDLATCWFDSLNYLLSASDLEKTFSNIARSLKSGGYFFFDIKTVYGLMDYFKFNISTEKNPCAVLLDSPEALVLSRPEWDYVANTATWRITGFLNDGARWERIEEVHKLRGYELSEVRAAMRDTGLVEIDCFGELLEMSGPGPDARRLWFVAKKE